MLSRTPICEHFEYSRSELVALIGARRLGSVRGILARYGHGNGCETCLQTIHEILEELRTSEKMLVSALKSHRRSRGWTALESSGNIPEEADADDSCAGTLTRLVNHRYALIRKAYPLRIAVTSSPLELEQVQHADVGVFIGEHGMDLFVCGQSGGGGRTGVQLASGLDEVSLIRMIDRFLTYYTMTADPYTSTGPWYDMLEVEVSHLRLILANDSLRIGADLDDLSHRLLNPSDVTNRIERGRNGWESPEKSDSSQLQISQVTISEFSGSRPDGVCLPDAQDVTV